MEAVPALVSLTAALKELEAVSLKRLYMAAAISLFFSSVVISWIRDTNNKR
jgi:hypothetical protein